MRVPLSWLREHAPVDAPGDEVGAALIRAGLEVERVERVGAGTAGVVVGEVLAIEELTEFKKPIRYVRLDFGGVERGVVCGASNFVVGDRVPVAVPGAVLPGDFRIAERQTYGRTSEGMICSAKELGLGDDHTGILVLDPDTPVGSDVDLSDEVLDIAVTPDRGYCLSVRGVAREAATAFGVPYTDPGLRAAPPAGDGHPVTVEDPGGCARYVALVVRGVDPAAPSPLWLRRRLALGGMRSISLAVDVTNYVLLGLGQPLHAFDLAKLAGGIVVRRARPGERLRTLDDVDRALDPADLVIADDSGAIAIAGVMGGASTEVSASTRDVLVESAHFEPVGIARTSRRHNLVSEASKRFERGVDPDLAPAAAATAADLLARLGGGTVEPVLTDVDARPGRVTIPLSPGYVSRLAGRDYPPDVVAARLRDVGCAVEGADPLTVTPPSWRPDLTVEVDLVEEVVRLEGYDAVPSVLPVAPAGRGLTRTQRLRRRLGRALAAAGWVETVAYPFVSAARLEALGLDPAEAPRIANPVADTEPLLRTSLLPGLLAALGRNVSRGLVDVAVYETGPVFLGDVGTAPDPGVAAAPDDGQRAALDAALPAQPERLAVAATGLREPRGHWGPGRAASWEDVVEAAREAGRALGVEVRVRRGDRLPWHPGRCAELLVGDTVVGYAGELHPRVLAALDLPARACAAEVDLAPLYAAAPDAVEAPDVPTYPPATVDVALVVDATTAAADVEAALRDGAGGLLEDLRLFDVYRGPQVGEGRASLAYALRFRSAEETLTDERVNAMRDAAVAEAARRTGAVLRG